MSKPPRVAPMSPALASLMPRTPERTLLAPGFGSPASAGSAGSTTGKPEKFLASVVAFETKLRRSNFYGSSAAAMDTVELLTTVISKGYFATVEELIDTIREIGGRLIRARPLELVIGNVVRRVLFIIRRTLKQLIDADKRKLKAEERALNLAREAAERLTLDEESLTDSGKTSPSGVGISPPIAMDDTLLIEDSAGGHSISTHSSSAAASGSGASLSSSVGGGGGPPCAIPTTSQLKRIESEEKISDFRRSGGTLSQSSSASSLSLLTVKVDAMSSSLLDNSNGGLRSGLADSLMNDEDNHDDDLAHYEESSGIPNLLNAFRGGSEIDLSSQFFNKYKAKLCAEMRELSAEIDGVYAGIEEYSMEHIHSDDVVLTYDCSRTVLHFFKHAAKTRRFDVIVVESAPSLNGHRMAKLLLDECLISEDASYSGGGSNSSDYPSPHHHSYQHPGSSSSFGSGSGSGSSSSSSSSKGGIKSVTVISDSAVFAMMARVNKVIIGTHSVLANGGILTDAGTHSIAVSARYYRVPLIVVTGLYKLSPLYAFDQGTFNQHGPSEWLLPGHDSAMMLAGDVDILNPTFDYVPPELVDLLVTNHGGHSASYIYRLLAEYYDQLDYTL